MNAPGCTVGFAPQLEVLEVLPLLSEVLPLVLEHAVAASSPETLCSLLQVSITCRRVVQQSVGHCNPSMAVARDGSLARLSQLAAWLPRHAGLVRGLHLLSSSTPTPNDCVVPQLMAFAIAACAQQHPAAVAAAAMVPASNSVSAGVQPHPLPLLLRTYFTDRIISPAMCSALAACSSLTHLELDEIPISGMTPALCVALGSLTTLRVLEVYAVDEEALPACFGDTVASLRQLTELRALTVPSSALERLPEWLQVAEFVVCGDEEGETGMFTAQLARLTELSRLDLGVTGCMTCTLPSSLVEVTVLGEVRARPLGGLRQLEEVLLDHPNTCMSLLSGVALGQLRSVDVMIQDCIAEEAQRMLGLICCCASVTQLSVSCRQDDIVGAGWLLHTQLQRLPELQFLQLNFLNLHPDDLQGLTTLSQLTELHLNSLKQFGDAGAVFIALNMPHLVHLWICWCGLSSDAIWPAVAACSNLRGLSIEDKKLNVTEKALRYLSRSTQLSRLGLSESSCVGFDTSSPQVLQFIAGMPHLASIDWL